MAQVKAKLVPKGSVDYASHDFASELKQLIEFENTITQQDQAISLRLQHIAESRNVALAAFVLRCKAMYDLSVLLAENSSSVKAAMRGDEAALQIIEEAPPVVAEFFKSHFRKSYSHVMDQVRVGRLIYAWLYSEYGDNPPIEEHMEPSYYYIAGRKPVQEGIKMLATMLGDVSGEYCKQQLKEYNRSQKVVHGDEEVVKVCKRINELIHEGTVTIYFSDKSRGWSPLKEEWRRNVRCWPTVRSVSELPDPNA